MKYDIPTKYNNDSQWLLDIQTTNKNDIYQPYFNIARTLICKRLKNKKIFEESPDEIANLTFERYLLSKNNKILYPATYIYWDVFNTMNDLYNKEIRSKTNYLEDYLKEDKGEDVMANKVREINREFPGYIQWAKCFSLGQLLMLTNSIVSNPVDPEKINQLLTKTYKVNKGLTECKIKSTEFIPPLVDSEELKNELINWSIKVLTEIYGSVPTDIKTLEFFIYDPVFEVVVNKEEIGLFSTFVKKNSSKKIKVRF